MLPMAPCLNSGTLGTFRCLATSLLAAELAMSSAAAAPIAPPDLPGRLVAVNLGIIDRPLVGADHANR